jgi:hypothetical protein
MKAKGLPTSGPEVELSKKFSIPFTCLLFAILGAPLGIKSSRSGKSGSFGVTVAVIIIYYIGLILTQNMGRIGKIHAYTSVWIPNIILLFVVVYVVYKMQKELPFKFMEKFIDFVVTIIRFFKNLFKNSTKKPVLIIKAVKKSNKPRPSLQRINHLRKVSNLKKDD